MYDARQISNWFIQKTQADKNPVTLSHLFKFIYLAHERYIVETGKPLFLNRIETWKDGPVLPDVYQAFHNQGVYVNNPHYAYENNVSSPRVQKILEDVYKEFGNLSLPALRSETNKKASPWHIMYYKFGRFTPLTYDVIKAIKKVQADHIKASLKPA